HGGESLLVERIMITAAQIAIQAEDQHRLDARVISAPNIRDIARQFARTRVTLASEPANSADIRLRSRDWHAFREHAHDRRILLRALVSANDIVIQDRFELPALILGHLGE